jgi:hypothetical protein
MCSAILASEGVTDPRAWGDALRDLGATAAVLLVVFFFCMTVILIWRGSKRLDIVGIGPEFQRISKAQERHTRDQRVIITWLAHAFDKDPPIFDEDPEANAPSAPPPPMPPVPGHAAARPADVPASRRAGRAPQRSRPQ